MGTGFSSTKVSNTQTASAFITQQFAGTCDVQCVNKMSDVTMTFINSNVDGVKLQQTCASNVNCIIGSSQNATADVLFKAAQSANAANASKWFSINLDSTKITSVQDIRENISQSTNQQCNVSSINEMNDVSILAVNSNIGGGGIALDQQGSASGNCQLTNNTTAAAIASGDTTNEGKSGKGANKDKTGKMRTITNIAIIAGIVFIIYIIAKVIAGHSQSSESSQEIAALTAAKVAAGCPGGGKPLTNQKTGEPLINPKTHGLYCPPPSATPSSTPLSTSTSTPLSTSSPNIAPTPQIPSGASISSL
jgi:hypothetical protein